MAIFTCPQCRTPSPMRSGTCRKCGQALSAGPMAAPPPGKRRLGAFLLLGAAGLCLMALLLNGSRQLSDEQLYQQASERVRARLGDARPIPALAQVEQKGLHSDGFFPPFNQALNQAHALEQHPGQFIVSGEIRFEDGEAKASYPWHCNLRRDGAETPEALLIDGDSCVFTGRDTRAQSNERARQVRAEAELMNKGLPPPQPKKTYDLTNPQETQACLQSGACSYREMHGKMTVVHAPAPTAPPLPAGSGSPRSPESYNLSDFRDIQACFRNGDCEFEEVLGVKNVVLKKKRSR